MLTFIYEQAELTAIGPANIAISYLTFIFSTTWAPTCRWQIKTQLTLATLAYTFNFGTGLIIPLVDVLMKYFLTCLGATVAGLSAGLLWVSQGRYIHLVCELNGEEGRAIKARCFGMFSFIYCLSHISAGLVTTFGLGLFNVEVYFLTITATGLLSVLFCVLFITNLDSLPKEQITT